MTNIFSQLIFPRKTSTEIINDTFHFENNNPFNLANSLRNFPLRQKIFDVTNFSNGRTEHDLALLFIEKKFIFFKHR